MDEFVSKFTSEVIAPIIAEARREARLAEREAIVAYLRREASSPSLSVCQNEWRFAAKAVEDCGHYIPPEGS